MTWEAIIDQMKEWVRIRGNLPPSYVINPAFPGLALPPGDFVVNDAWHTWDLSAIVPEYVKALSCSVRVSCDTVGKVIRLRPTGDTLTPNRCIGAIQIANVVQNFYIAAEISSDRKLDYQIQIANWTIINFRIRGWWF